MYSTTNLAAMRHRYNKFDSIDIDVDIYIDIDVRLVRYNRFDSIYSHAPQVSCY